MDDALFTGINGMAGHHRVLDLAMVVLASVGPYALMAALLAVWLWPGPRERRDHRQSAVMHATLAVALALLANQTILLFWRRPRPFTVHATTLLLAPSVDPSFPSDHATFSFAVAMALACTLRRPGIAALALAASIAFARVYTGEHYASDVLGGAVIGCLAAFATLRVVPRFMRLLEPALRLARKLRLA